MLYPLKFEPIYKQKVWGGDKIKDIKSDQNVPNNCGESWEISAVQGDLSVVSNGFLKGNTIEEIIEIYMGEVVGDKVFDKFGIEFPILVKIIESKENLSLQVHPDNIIAAKRHNAWGKSELWYILNADPGSKLISGFNQNVNSKIFFDSIENGNFDNYLNKPEIKTGEVYYIPAGRLHSLGKGVTLVEIQQTSDITYRVYDYGRKDRELHLDLAEDVIDYKQSKEIKTSYKHTPDISNNIIKNELFTVNFLPVMNTIIKDYYEYDSFIIYHLINGKITVITDGDNHTSITKGETVLIPSSLRNIKIIPQQYSEILEIYI
ncbi:MAG TPA: class I mannose-6-phosphate isomerase [Bacteroidales bacterium]|nr:class I mannose-6-phosphate isomerase [Bacteroidales bacterium]